MEIREPRCVDCYRDFEDETYRAVTVWNGEPVCDMHARDRAEVDNPDGWAAKCAEQREKTHHIMLIVQDEKDHPDDSYDVRAERLREPLGIPELDGERLRKHRQYLAEWVSRGGQ